MPRIIVGALLVTHVLPRRRRRPRLARSPSAGSPVDARQRRAHEIRPWRIGRRVVQHGAPFGGGGIAVAVLLVGKTEEIARLRLVRIAGDGALESLLGLIGHDAIGGGDQRLAEIGFARRAVAVERDRLAPRHDRVVEAAEPQIDRRDHLPAGAVIGIARKMRLDLADKARDRLAARRGCRRGEGRLRRNIRASRAAR